MATLLGGLVVAGSSAAAATSSAPAAPDAQPDVVVLLEHPPMSGYGAAAVRAVETAAGGSGRVEVVEPQSANAVDVLTLLASSPASVVVVEGWTYGPALAEVAVEFPEQSFVWLPGMPVVDPATPPAGLPNVSTIYVDVNPVATLLGQLVAAGVFGEFERLGWTGSSEPSGADLRFIEAFVTASGLGADDVVLTSRTGPSSSAAEPPSSSAGDAAGFDLLLVSGEQPSMLAAPLRVELGGAAPGDAADLEDLRRIVVALRYDVVLAELLAARSDGEPIGGTYELTLEDGGLALDASADDDAELIRLMLVAAGILEPIDSAPPTTEEPFRPVATTEPPAGSAGGESSGPPETDRTDSTGPTEPTEPATTTPPSSPPPGTPPRVSSPAPTGTTSPTSVSTSPQATTGEPQPTIPRTSEESTTTTAETSTTPATTVATTIADTATTTDPPVATLPIDPELLAGLPPTSNSNQ